MATYTIEACYQVTLEAESQSQAEREALALFKNGGDDLMEGLVAVRGVFASE